jgi:hypothetical protein
MYLEPELHDEVVTLIETDERGRPVDLYSSVRVPPGRKGRVSYASYTGHFFVQWEDEATDRRYEREALGTVLRISRPRRGRKKSAELK